MIAPTMQGPSLTASEGSGEAISTADAVNAGELTLTTVKDEARVDTRLLAQHLGIQHTSLFKLLKNYATEFTELGKVGFQIVPSADSSTGQALRYAMLNEDHSYLLLSFSRNTARVRQLKLKLVKAFREARRAVDIRKAEYLPSYHRLHDEIHALAAGSANEVRVHQNVNKLVNKTAGLEAGQRSRATLPQQSVLIVAQALAASAMHGAIDHRDGYQRAKQALEPLAALTRGGAAAAAIATDARGHHDPLA